MPPYARKDIVIEGEVGIYHCISRCARRALLRGEDRLTGWDFIHERTGFATGCDCFAIALCDCAVMTHHS